MTSYKQNEIMSDFEANGRVRKGVFLRRISPSAVMRFVPIAACLLITAIPCGCGDGGPERAVVSGTVTYQGQPLPKGTIRFLPAKDNKVPMSGAMIVEGKYKADKRGGVPIGTHRVVIEAIRPQRRNNMPGGAQANPGGGLVPQEQYLPAKYNTQSQLRITLEPGTGSVEKNFEL